MYHFDHPVDPTLNAESKLSGAGMTAGCMAACCYRISPMY